MEVLDKPKKSRSKANAAASDISEAMVMDEHIWKELPKELLEAIIVRLPVASFFRFRVVCREWNSLLFSRRWEEEAPRKRPWFFVTLTGRNGENGAMYDPCTKKWHHCCNIPSLSSFAPAASAGGLVCYFDHKRRSFHVGNPLTQSWKELHVNHNRRWWYGVVGMILNQDYLVSRGYKIIWVNELGTYEVYDSLKNLCGGVGRVSDNITLPLRIKHDWWDPLKYNKASTVSIGTIVYFFDSDRHKIVSYDVATGAWEQLIIGIPMHSTEHLALAEGGGEIMLVGLVREHYWDFSCCVCVWKLERTMLMWKEVDRMPSSWCSEFNDRRTEFACFGNTGLLMMSLKKLWMNRVFTYHVLTREWSKVPQCVLPGHKKPQLIQSGTLFFPSL